MAAKKTARIALLSAMLYVSKVIADPLPNVELVSLFIIIFALIFGWETMWAVAVFNILQLAQWGFGLWWVSYLYVWPLLTLAALALKPIIKEEFLVWAVFSGGFGLIFGALFAVAYIPVSPAAALSYWIGGLSWDLWHCLCNFILMLALGRPAYKLIKRTAKSQ